ncbi:hypothetical protein QWZ10_12765 [Paracoccus cavernae]|uniref:Uncharacterized protein n=1 Tax=Paracoccus cavernae TaxID=1571207 RepID=A0ABT8D7T7_9RHOB|nr:hypothetical protein [Paracoccus cavernae]
MGWIVDFVSDPSAPSGGAVYDKPTIPDELTGLFKKPYADDPNLAWRKFSRIKNVAIDRGWVEDQTHNGGSSGELRLTPAGYDRWDWHQTRTFYSRLASFGKTALGAVVVNLALPAVVAFITVVLTNHLSPK